MSNKTEERDNQGNRIDWRFALSLVVDPLDEYGWIPPSDVSKTDIYGDYDYIDWRSDNPKPSRRELVDAWELWVSQNGGTPDQITESEEMERSTALERLKEKVAKGAIGDKESLGDIVKLLAYRQRGR